MSLRFAERSLPFFKFPHEVLHAVKTQEHVGLAVAGRRKLVSGDGVAAQHAWARVDRWLEAQERASASRPWEHSSVAMAMHAPVESIESREGVGRQVRGVRAARHLHIASVGEVAVMRTSTRATWQRPPALGQPSFSLKSAELTILPQTYNGNSIFPILYLSIRWSFDHGGRVKDVDLCEVNNISLSIKS